MTKVTLALFCSLLGILATGVASPPQVNGQIGIPVENLVGVLRTLNTAEVVYQRETGRFAYREEMLTFLRKEGTIVSHFPIDLENPKPYELAITTSPDGMHYQVTLKRPYDPSDKNSGCRAAVFTDEAGVIFIASALGCE